MKYSDPDAAKPPEVEKAEIDHQMEALRRRSAQLQRQMDARLQAQGLPSRLDLRPKAPEAVHEILRAFHLLKITDGQSGFVHVPYDQAVLWAGRHGVPESQMTETMHEMEAKWNAILSERHEEARQRARH